MRLFTTLVLFIFVGLIAADSADLKPKEEFDQDVTSPGNLHTSDLKRNKKNCVLRCNGGPNCRCGHHHRHHEVRPLILINPNMRNNMMPQYYSVGGHGPSMGNVQLVPRYRSLASQVQPAPIYVQTPVPYALPPTQIASPMSVIPQPQVPLYTLPQVQPQVQYYAAPTVQPQFQYISTPSVRTYPMMQYYPRPSVRYITMSPTFMNDFSYPSYCPWGHSCHGHSCSHGRCSHHHHDLPPAHREYMSASQRYTSQSLEQLIPRRDRRHETDASSSQPTISENPVSSSEH